MNFIDKMERKIGKYTIHNLSLCLIICYAFGYAINFVNADFLQYLTLDPKEILSGEVWRIFTWILVPPSKLNIFTVIMLYFYYSIGTTLEKTWGAFHYNFYIFSGIICTVLGSLLLYASCELGIFGNVYVLNGGSTVFYEYVGLMFTTYYINMSIFLAFAATFPEVQVLLMFIIPIKVKWMGIAYGVLLVFEFFTGNIVSKFVIAASLLNFIIFFMLTRRATHLSPKQIKRRTVYKRQVQKAAGITKHKCAICGRTEQDHPELAFRFCSKCDGNYEYCEDHLFTHEHILRH